MDKYLAEVLEAIDYSPESSLEAVHGLIHNTFKWRDHLYTEIKGLSAAGIHSDQAVEEHTNMLHESIYREAACSHAAVGALAPFFESLLTREFASLKGFYGSRKVATTHHRWILPREKFWDPHFIFQSSGKKPGTDLAKGTDQLLAALNVTPLFPGDFTQRLLALFSYRNQSLHNGYEWPVAIRTHFLERMDRAGCRKWFQHSTSDNKPWIILLADNYIKESLASAEKVIHIFENIRSNTFKLWGPT
jgi:hypothetical protein